MWEGLASMLVICMCGLGGRWIVKMTSLTVIGTIKNKRLCTEEKRRETQAGAHLRNNLIVDGRKGFLYCMTIITELICLRQTSGGLRGILIIAYVHGSVKRQIITLKRYNLRWSQKPKLTVIRLNPMKKLTLPCDLLGLS